MSPQVGREELAKVIGYRTNAGAPTSVVPRFIGEKLFDTSGLDFYVAFGVASGNWTPMGINTLTATELGYLDGALTTNLVASKAAILGTGGALTLGGSLTAVGSLIIGSADLNEADMEKLDEITNGTVAANKAVIADANTNIGIVKATELHIGASGSETQVTATAAELNYTDVTTAGPAQASKALVADANIDVAGVRNFTGLTLLDATSVETSNLKAKDGTAVATIADTTGALAVSKTVTLDGNTLATEAAAGVTGGTGTVYKSAVVKTGGVIITRILLDLTGLASSTTDLDIIGQGVSAAHLGQITAERNGTILSGTVICMETPAGGADDIDLYSATEATGVFDGVVGDLTETALLTRGAAWAAGDIKPLTAWPAANDYLYLTGGEAGTAATYTAGKFLIELQGYVA